MTDLRTWWRCFGGLLAVVLALALVAPQTVDAAICFNEPASATAQAADDPSMRAEASPQETGNPGKGHLGEPAGACQHGHCHHAGPVLPTSEAEPSAPATAAAAMLPLQTHQHTQHLVARLDRPPRA
ncbi:hypothetical protein [Phenylobacterium sp.]|uniref:hypothetical protein n=1 Tax=Phenylobacterium sp. TaxID=1871053 RepID=UPI00391ABD60